MELNIRLRAFMIRAGAIVMFSSIISTGWPRPLIIAHRGASAECPENTMASFRRAWEVGADAVELDVYRAADGKVVVIHDGTTKHTTGKDYVVTATTSRVLRELDAGKWKGPQFAGEKIPYLEEVLSTVPKGKRLFIELKGDVSTVEPVVEVLRQHGTTEGITIISFNMASLKEFKRQMPAIPAYWLRGTREEPGTKKPLPHPVQWLDEVSSAGLDGIDVHYKGMTKEFMEAAKKRNIPVYVWTVDTEDEARRQAELGVAGITTDKPRELLALFGRDGF
jgi:glycerophosphoryl diester phosphodiesterase